MLTEIVMHQTASYREPAILRTDKRINLIYGLNGTGKTTLARYLYRPNGEEFAQCSLAKPDSTSVLVYTRDFIRDHFYESRNIPGIFTLSKENKEIEEALDLCNQELKQLLVDEESAKKSEIEIRADLEEARTVAASAVWKIKQQYAGGDRPLDYCLDKFKGSREALLGKLLGAERPCSEPEYSAQYLEMSAKEVTSDESEPVKLLDSIQVDLTHIEESSIYGLEIHGAEEGKIAALIKALDNADWVRRGLSYLPSSFAHEREQCPFCQEHTVTEDLRTQLSNYFSGAYDEAVNTITQHLKAYKEFPKSLPPTETISSHRFAQHHASELKGLISRAQLVFERNVKKIQEKLASPSKVVELESSTTFINEINECIKSINGSIKEYNGKLQNKEQALRKIKENFWNRMRWDFDHVLARYAADKERISKKLEAATTRVAEFQQRFKAKQEQIAALQASTVNVEGAVANINTALSELGLEGFRIEKHKEDLYKLSRPGTGDTAFESLSEGEKTIISFLYFCELCKGRKKDSEEGLRKVVVIDDPVSSLSHTFVFNLGRLIKTEFMESESFEQIFVLTHSLYFFYELADRKEKRRHESSKLFRVEKIDSASVIREMRYNQIQNDYQAFWSVVNNKDAPPAIVANSMRSIIEHFFGFVEKSNSLHDVFTKPALKANKFQAFSRFMDRESHADAQNVFDFKEFDYETFRAGLELIFDQMGYREHFERMKKIT